MLLKADGQDRDGIELFFTSSNIEVRGQKKAYEFTKAMERARPHDVLESAPKKTDIRTKMGEIFDNYIYDNKHKYIYDNKPRRSRFMYPKSVTLIVLTDGIWASMSNRNDVDRTIIEFVHQVNREAGPVSRQRPSASNSYRSANISVLCQLRYHDLDDLRAASILNLDNELLTTPCPKDQSPEIQSWAHSDMTDSGRVKPRK